MFDTWRDASRRFLAGFLFLEARSRKRPRASFAGGTSMRVTMHSLEGRTLFSAGLSAQYFDNADLTSLRLTRTDAQINFDWASASPSANIGADTFSTRWTGYVQ